MCSMYSYCFRRSWGSRPESCSERGLSIWASSRASDNPCRQAAGVWRGQISCTDKEFPTVRTCLVDWWNTSIFCFLILRRSQYFWRARASSSTFCFNAFHFGRFQNPASKLENKRWQCESRMSVTCIWYVWQQCMYLLSLLQCTVDREIFIGKKFPPVVLVAKIKCAKIFRRWTIRVHTCVNTVFKCQKILLLGMVLFR